MARSFAGFNGPDLSIIIVNRNTRELLRQCLESIRALPDRVSLEVIVVDNASSDGSREMLRDEYPDARLILNETNTGFAQPNNQGLEVSIGRYVMLLNSDTEVRPGALDRLVAFMDVHPDAGACGPRLLYPDGRLQPSCISFSTPWRSFCEMAGLASLFPRSRHFAAQESWFEHDRVMAVEALMGAALLVRREVLETLGALDERFRIYCNEVDWCFRMEQAGWKRYFVPDAEVVHHLSATLKKENEVLQLQGEMLQNHFDYFRKHHGSAGLFWFRLSIALGFSLRRARYAIQNRVRPTTESRRLALLSEGMVRAARTGNPHQFRGAPPR